MFNIFSTNSGLLNQDSEQRNSKGGSYAIPVPKHSVRRDICLAENALKLKIG